MLARTPEPELMLDPAQASAYAEADFELPHARMIAALRERLPGLAAAGRALDLGCGPADIAVRFARAFPGWQVDGVDGSVAMLALGEQAIRRAGLADRVHLHELRLPAAGLPSAGYDLVLSNSLLHHLRDPRALWSSLRLAGADARGPCAVFVMDLVRPESEERAEALVAHYAAGEPDILQRDFRRSLHAAYRPDEVRRQLELEGLAHLELEIVSDRHWIVWGDVAAAG